MYGGFARTESIPASRERGPGRAQALEAVLCAHSYYSLGVGTASPKTLVERAAELGYRYLALTDHLSVSGGVELFEAAREQGLRALIGATVPVRIEERTFPLVLIARSRQGYARLNTMITLAHEREEKDVPWPVLISRSEDLALLTGDREGFPSVYLAERRVSELESLLRELAGAFPNRLYLQLYHDLRRWDTRRTRVLRRLAYSLGLPVVAAPPVRYARPGDYRLYDALVCGRLGITVEEPNAARPRNAESYLLEPEVTYERLPFPEAHANANALARESHFELLPERLIPPRAQGIPDGVSPEQHLEERCYAALLERYPGERLAQARKKLEEEMATVRALGLAEFFLVAAEVTDYCRNHGILAAGRGSAAASILCYLLGITGADPLKHDLLFERFLHTGKSTMPDVDIDISSSRRDEVLAWVEERFGAATEAMVCNKIRYRLPLALQDLGRALGVPPELRNQLTSALGRDYRGLRPPAVDQAEEVFEEVLPGAPAADALRSLVRGMEAKHVRHLAPHSGGVVLSRDPLSHYSPLERSSGGIKIIQLDKDDAEAMGLIKLDLLGLRMLSALERAREEIFRMEGEWWDLHDLPDDERVWDLISSGETMGLFQVESPSQMHTSQVMKARNLKDLSHQIALIRPGPIQSGTVHPYLRRRQGLEPVTYLHPSLEPILAKSYGVLLFQEDVLRIAVHVAGMSWTEADRFRKKVSGFSDLDDIEPERQSFIQGAMRKVGATPEEAEAIFESIKAYQGFGFAESHAWAFALHSYASGYLRIHYPAEFLAAILSEEPGMWSQSTKRQEARAWGVPVLPFDINRSGVYFRCERLSEEELRRRERPGKQPERAVKDKAIRPPLCALDGISEEAAREIVLERLRNGPFVSLDDLYGRVKLPRETFETLLRSGALDELGSRREMLYRLGVLAGAIASGSRPLLSPAQDAPELPRLVVKDRFMWEFETARFSPLEMHPLDFVRDQLRELNATPLIRLLKARHGTSVRTAGLVVGKQKPPTAKGHAFFVLEDGPHRIQLVISPTLWEARREVLRDAVALIVDGTIEGRGDIKVTLKAESIYPLAVPAKSRGYHFG
ncbi:MAG TPA: DNA polymerase III subunit alpha [Trueperaceae bacterium]